MARYRPKWPLGTEARLMFDILHYTFLRLGDAHRFGPPHLRQIVRSWLASLICDPVSLLPRWLAVLFAIFY